MYLRRPLTALLLITLILLISFVGGCGGGDQPENQQEAKPGGAKKQHGEAKQHSEANKGAPQYKIGLGIIRKVDTEARTIRLRPSSDKQKGIPVRFKIVENARITLDGDKAELADVKEGQQAQITYRVRKKTGVARQIVLFSDGR